MRIIILAFAVAISLAVFACSDSPSSPSTEDSSSSLVSLSSSSDANFVGTACEYSGEEFGLKGLFICEEAPNFLGHKAECEEEGGSWVKACPNGEKATCIDDEDPEEILYKLYADGFTCGDLILKNADGSKDIVSTGGACGPFSLAKNIKLSMCIEFPTLPTTIVALSCAELDAPFAKECSANADLICYEPENDMIHNFYGEAVFSSTCESFGLEEFNP